MTLFQLYQWAMDNVPEVRSVTLNSMRGRRFSYKLGLNKQEQFLVHSFILIFKDTLRTRTYSSSTITREDCVAKLSGDQDVF